MEQCLQKGSKNVLSWLFRGSDINIVKWSIEDSWYLHEAARRASKIIRLSDEMIKNVLSSCPEVNGKTLIIPNEYEGECSGIVWRSFP